MLTAVPPRVRLPRAPSFVVAAVSLFTAAAAAGIPAPLYVVYQELYGISPAGLTGAFAIYIVPLVAMLLTCGRLSDHVGRRTVAVPALLLATLATLVLTQVDSVAVLMVGRAIQGLSVGLALGALAAYVVDLGPALRPGVASAAVTGAPTGGVALGALFSGAIVEYGPHPTVTVYVVAAAVLLACATGIVLAPETVVRRPGVLRSLRPAIRIPRARAVFAAACLCIIACYGLGGFFQALASSVAAQVLGQTSHLSGGLVVAALHLTAPLGSGVAGRWRPRFAIAGGAAVMILGVLALMAAVVAGTFAGFLAASVVAGLGFGSTFVGAMRTILDGRGAEDRAGTLSAVYLICYLGAAGPSFLAGVAAGAWGLGPVSLGFCALVIVLAVAGTTWVLIAAGAPSPEPRAAMP